MKRKVGLPSNQLTLALLSRLQQFNRYLPYLPGVRNKFDPNDIREMLYNALPTYVHTEIATADYKWFNNTETTIEVSSYFNRLLVIGSMARGEKPKPAHQSVARKRNDSKKIISETHKKGNMGHEETQCCYKQKASSEVQKKAKFKTETHENSVIDIDGFSDEFERLDELPEIQEFMEKYGHGVQHKGFASPQSQTGH
jgi:hypothetical protein